MDFYEVLGVANNASSDDIKRAFKKLAVRFHPDKTNDPNHHAKFVKINEAYETLKDSDKRQQYDYKTRILEPEYTDPLRNFYNPFFSTSNPLAFAKSPNRRDFEQGRKKREEELRADQKARERQQLYQRLAREEELRQKAAKAREEAERRSKELREQRMKQSQGVSGVESHEGSAPGKSTSTSESYYNRRRSAYRSAWHGSGTNSSDPIVLSDEEGRSREPEGPWRGKVEKDVPHQGFGDQASANSEQRSSNNDQNGSSSHSNVSQGKPDRTALNGDSSLESNEESEEERDDNSERDEFFDARNLFGAPIRELPRKNRNNRSMGPRTFSKVNGRVSPIRQSHESYERRKIPTRSPLRSPERTTHSPEKSPTKNFGPISNGGKKFKPNSFNLNSLDEMLNPGPEISMDGLEGVLPGSSKRVNSNMHQRHKRFKGYSSEYIDGRSHADTIFRPVNDKMALAGKFASLTMKDWGADPEIFQMKPPMPPNLSKVLQGDLVKVLTQYDKEFAVYKRRILGYQQQRLDRDEMFQSMKYDAKEFGVYKRCVEQDAVIARRFSEAHNEYVVTMLSLNSRG